MMEKPDLSFDVFLGRRDLTDYYWTYDRKAMGYPYIYIHISAGNMMRNARKGPLCSLRTPQKP